MSISEIFTNVFGEFPSTAPTTDFPPTTDFTFEQHISELQKWIDLKLANFEDDSKQESFDDIPSVRDGFIGGERIVFDCEEQLPAINVSLDGLLVQNPQSPFATVKANCCVYRGKWMYEVQLRSKGIMQIGWCSAKCQFTEDTGIGDTPNSYGLDGSKQRLWNVKTRKYGPFWRSGDIFGICLDMDNGKIEYYRNGVGLGEAFTDIERGPGIALFPAVSLAVNETVVANFGGSPFRHPIAGYNPLEEKPTKFLAQADFLLQNLVNLARFISCSKMTTPKRDELKPSNKAIYMILANLLMEKLAPMLLNSYVMEDKILTYVQSMCVLRSDTDSNSVIYPGQPNSTLSSFLTLMWTYLNIDAKEFISKFVDILLSLYRETPADLEYAKQRKVIVILRCLCNHAATRKYLLEFKFFKKNCLPIFLYIKPPDEETLGELLPNDMIWTEGLGGSKEAYLKASDKLIQCTDGLYVLQKNFIETLLQNNDDDDAVTPTSRKIFVDKMKKYVRENSLEQRTIYLLQGHYTVPCQPAVGLSFLCILLDVLRHLFQSETSDQNECISPRLFCDGTLQYHHMDRLGGNLSYLQNLYKTELVNMLGNDHVMLTEERPGAESQSNLSMYSAMFLITGSSSNNDFFYLSQPNRDNMQEQQQPNVSVPSGNMDSYQSISELLDSCILYYYAVAHKYIIMIADLRENISVLSNILTVTKSSLEDIKVSIERMNLPTDENEKNGGMEDILTELHERFLNRNNVFAKRSMELARKQVWYRSVALGSRRRELLSWMLQSIFNTLHNASALCGLFTFVPEIYINILPILLDTIMDFSFHDIEDQYDQTDNKHILELGASFLTKHSGDDRIILATCKDSLLQAIGTLVCHKYGMTALENTTEENHDRFIKSLLRPYEERAWGQSNWLLTRFWLGNGFAFRDARPPSIWQGGKQRCPLGLIRSRGKNGSHTGLLHHIAPPCPSEHFHAVIRQVLTTDDELCSIFMNSVLTQLNWAFSEFILFVQEIQKSAQEYRSEIEPRQLKVCSMCFELTVSLMRSLEMIINIAPNIFKDASNPNSELLTIRVCQVISQLMSRVTVPPASFQHIIDLCLPDLSGVTHFAIISAALGILLALLSDELSPDDNLLRVPPISKILLNDESFQIASLEFALGTIRTPIQRSEKIPLGNFDPMTRDNIDPMTNELKVESLPKSGFDVPIIKFNLREYMSHVTEDELQSVQTMIDLLLKRTAIMSHVTVPSEDSICSICYAKAVSCNFYPCKHQSCSNCILQHLMSNSFCFYCKTSINNVTDFAGAVIYESKTQDILN